MMVGPKRTTAAFVDAEGAITTEDINFEPLKKKYPILGKPFIRGIFSMIDSMRRGYAALSLSADKFLGEEEEEPTGIDKWLTDHLGDKMTGVIMAIAGVLGVGLAIVLFFMLPTILFNGLDYLTGGSISFLRSIFEGVLRMGIFIAYIAIVSLVPDIKRTFMYHGAEHKTIFCYESGEELTVENVRKHTRFHPRCGTSFIVLLLILSIIVGFFIPVTDPILRTICKILTIPIVMNLGFELLQYCGRHDNLFTKISSTPGLWVQRLTTKEPDDRMIQAAIAALKEVIPEDGSDFV